MTGPAIASFFKGGQRPLVVLPYSFFEPAVVATTLLLLFLLLLGTFLKGRETLYMGLLWFYLTLSPLLYQPSFGQISLTTPSYPCAIGLFLVILFFIEKFVSR